MGLAIIQHVSLIESDESGESQRNKDVIYLSLTIRLVKCGQPFHNHRNMDATCDWTHVSPSVGVPVSRQSQDVLV